MPTTQRSRDTLRGYRRRQVRLLGYAQCLVDGRWPNILEGQEGLTRGVETIKMFRIGKKGGECANKGLLFQNGGPYSHGSSTVWCESQSWGTTRRVSPKLLPTSGARERSQNGGQPWAFHGAEEQTRNVSSMSVSSVTHRAHRRECRDRGRRRFSEWCLLSVCLLEGN